MIDTPMLKCPSCERDQHIGMCPHNRDHNVLPKNKKDIQLEFFEHNGRIIGVKISSLKDPDHFAIVMGMNNLK